jgi:hypothetical protein
MPEAIRIMNRLHRNPLPRSCSRRCFMNLKVPRDWAPHLSVYSPSCPRFCDSLRLLCGSYSRITCPLGKPSIFKQP